MPKVNTYESVRVTSKRGRDRGGRKKEKEKDERENENLGMNRILYRCRCRGHGRGRSRRRCRRCQRDLHAEMVFTVRANVLMTRILETHPLDRVCGAYCAAAIGHPANTLKSENCFFFFFFFFMLARHYFVYENGNPPRQRRKSVPRE